MLYTSTRNPDERYSVQHALNHARSDDGGLFVPMQLPVYTHTQLLEMMKMSAHGLFSKILNDLLGTSFTQRDLEFTLGKNMFGHRSINHRIVVGEFWRNPGEQIDYITSRLYSGMLSETFDKTDSLLGQLIVRIASLFVIYFEIQPNELISMDISVPTGRFLDPMACWYARKMGLPFKNIICCSNENDAVWDFLQLGYLKPDADVLSTNTDNCDSVIPEGLEWLIYETLGVEETNQFVSCMEVHSLYEPDEDLHRKLKEGMYASVVGAARSLSIIPNIYNTMGYILCPYSALAYCGLMDYRCLTGGNRSALLMSTFSPMLSAEVIEKAMGVSRGNLIEKIKQM